MCYAGYFSSQLHISNGQVRGRTLHWENDCTGLAVTQDCRAFSWLVIDVWGPSSLWVLPPLDGLRKKAKRSWASRPVSSIPPWPLLQFLPPGFWFEFQLWLPSMMGCDVELQTEINSFLPHKLLLSMVFYHNNRNSNKCSKLLFLSIKTTFLLQKNGISKKSLKKIKLFCLHIPPAVLLV